MIFFFDTCAIVDLLEEKKEYEQYASAEMVINVLNLIEYDYYCIKTNKKDRKLLYQYLKEFCLPITDDIIQEAMEFRYKYRQKDISYVDAIGYCMAKKNKLKFLTGDHAFKDFPNVEFVK